ncbi:hypothetical protein [Actinomadura terrae]|uniref:hypothetical protein n=1 Tax=Actinomadura terrae TaxID=604353 RepID=UPI001FA7CF05|nr:hypothetical protein [Actinomadura terrae]
MADTKETQDRDRIERLMVNLAAARVSLGVAALAAPGLTAKVLGLGGSDPGRDYLARMFGAREVALGAGYLLSDRSGRRMWTRVGCAVDTVDIMSGLRTRPGLPLWSTAAGTGIAAVAATLGAAKITKDLLG